MLGGLFGGSTQNQTTTTKPWGPQRAPLRRLFGEAGSQLDAAQEGGSVAGFSPDQLAGMDMARALAAGGSPGAGTIDAGTQALISAMTGTSGPGLDEMVQAATRPAVRAFEEQTMPSISRGANVTGGLGGGRQGVAEGVAARGLQDTVADTAVQVQNEQANRALRAAGMAPGMAQAATAAEMFPIDLLMQIGGAEQEMEQALLDAPWQDLFNYQALISGNYGGTTTQPVSRTNPLLQGLGGAATGAGIGAQFGQPGIGAGLGGLIGLFG